MLARLVTANHRAGISFGKRLLHTNGGFSSTNSQVRPWSQLFRLTSCTKQQVLQGCRRSTTVAAPVRAYPDISAQAQRKVGLWMVTCAGMCVGAVAIGGVTRLTESGLSITKWDPVTGMRPPIGSADWEKAFEMYKETPEYKFVHQELTLNQFKAIYMMEWSHRIWGRLVGAVFLLPAVYFWKKGYLAKAMKKRMFIYGGLLGLQAFLGIYMVNSGLVDKDNPFEVPRVSQYRLASHLSAALVLYAGFLWSGLNHLLPIPQGYTKTAQIARLAKYSHMTMALIFFTAASGAFVAGLDAGMVYNTWPKFADRWIPTDIMAFDPKWKNFFENHTMVQFNHRHMGELTGMATIGLWLLARRTPLPPRAMLAAHCLAGMAAVQITLGIGTLLMFVPTSLAATHQSGSLALLGFAIWLANELKRIPK